MWQYYFKVKVEEHHELFGIGIKSTVFGAEDWDINYVI